MMVGLGRQHVSGPNQPNHRSIQQPMEPIAPDPDLIEQLARDSRSFDHTANEAERNCWLAVHRHVHGVLPSEYDIRDVPEELYLAVLERRRHLE
jgi:hypothetical protein